MESFEPVPAFEFHQEFDGITANSCGKALESPFYRIHHKRWGFFFLKGTVCPKPRAFFLQAIADTLLDNLENV